MGIDASDKLQTNIDRPYCTPEQRSKAYAILRRRHAEGRLPPVLDGTGNTVKDYADMLGLSE